MRSLVFQSSHFRPYLPDECQVNPNVLGFELAAWLSRELAGRGIISSYPNYEDWGWLLTLTEGDDEFMICCGGGEEGSTFEWRIFVSQPKKLFGRTVQSARSDELLDIIQQVLNEASIQCIVEQNH